MERTNPVPEDTKSSKVPIKTDQKNIIMIGVPPRA